MAELTTTGLKISSGGRSYWSIVSGGITYNLDDLGFLVISYIGAGLPPSRNITLPFGISGYETYQATIPQPRVITLIGTIEGDSLLEITKQRQALINFFRIGDRSSPLITLVFQLIDRYGAAYGKQLQMPCHYVGGLEGNTDNIWGENIPLQFVEHAPPSIVEAATNTVTMTAPTLTSYAASTRLFTRNPLTGAWTDTEGAFGSAIRRIAYDSAGFLWTALGGGAHRIGDSYGVEHTTAGAVNVLHPGQDGYLYTGGVYSQVERYNPATGTWSNVGPASFTGGTSRVKDVLYGYNGIYVTGDYTSPTGFLRYVFLPTDVTWNAISLGATGYGTTLALGQDLNQYVGGSFTQSGVGGTCNNIAKIVNYGLVAMSTGTNGPVNKILILPDGRVLVLGAFTTAGGITCGTGTLGVNAVGLAVWDGYRWDAWPGVYGGSGLVMAINPSNGKLFGDGINPLFNGVEWVAGNGFFNGGNMLTDVAFNSDATLAIATSSASLALASSGQVVTNLGSAEVFPQIKIVGNPVLRNITNYTTGKSIQLNGLGQVTGGISLLQMGGSGGVSFQNNLFGNAMKGFSRGGDIANFNLAPGPNNIVAYYETQDANNYVQLVYQNTHWSFDSATIGL